LKKIYARLLNKAKTARKNAYCPYSKFKVGAAVLAGRTKIYTGANVENASYGLSCCAERVAVFKAVADGHREITAVAVAGPGARPTAPCGACRQVIYEFGRNADVIMPGKNKAFVKRISELMPEAFGGENIKRK
jgi:cytidine deaminase